VGSPAETLSSLSLAQPGLDRHAELRLDPHLIPRLVASGSTRVVELFGDRTVVDADDDGLRLALRAPRPQDAEALTIFLGTDRDGTAYLGVVHPPTADGAVARVATAVLPSTTPVDGDDRLHTLRQVGAELSDRDASLFVTTLALGNWHASHGFCPRCGAPTEPVQAGWLRRCTREGSEHYPRTDPAVIMSVVDDQDRLLLARGNGWGPGRFSVLAGFVEPGESLAAAVAREVREEVGIEVDDVTYLGDQPWPFPTSLMVGFTARARSTGLHLQESEIAEARWFTREELEAAVADGTLGVSPRVSISRRLLERWLGHEIVPSG
jgi:NAD+ diphosphatase